MRAIFFNFLAALTAVLLAQPAMAADAAGPSRPVVLRRAVIALNEDQVWGTEGSDILLCKVSTITLRWRSGRLALPIERLAGIFNEEVARAGLNSGEDNNLFQDGGPSDRLQAGALIKNMNAHICFLASDQYPTDYRGTVDTVSYTHLTLPTKA